MAVTREILNSHPIGHLKKEISKTNIKGYSKMNKAQIVDVMMKHKERFSHITHYTKAPKATKAKPAPEKPKYKFKIKEKKPATPSPKTPAPKTPTRKAKTPTPKAKTPTPKTPTPKAKTPTPKAKTPTPKAKTPTPKSKTPSPKSPAKKLEYELFDESYEDWKQGMFNWDEPYAGQPFTILKIPVIEPDTKLPTYKKLFSLKSWWKEQKDDHTAGNLMDLAHQLLYGDYDTLEDFFKVFKKDMPDYFKYFIQYYKKDAGLPIGDEKATPEKEATQEEENEKLTQMLLDDLEEGSKSQEKIKYGREYTRYGYLSDITAIKDKNKDSAKTKIINLMRKVINERTGQKTKFTGFKGKKIEYLIKRALKEGVKPNLLMNIWDNYVYFQNRTDF
jgi:hypothetical protein